MLRTNHRILIGLLSSAAMFTIPAAAQASDHMPPRVTLHASGKVLKGSPWTFSWQRPALPTGCVAAHADGVPDYGGRGLSIGSGERVLNITLHKRQKPRRVHVQSWTQLDEDGSPAGRSRVLAYRLLGRGSGEGRRWIVRLRRLFISGDLYLDVYASWPETEGCGGIQSGNWDFHVAP